MFVGGMGDVFVRENVSTGLGRCISDGGTFIERLRGVVVGENVSRETGNMC